jgi:hypothetical protein
MIRKVLLFCGVFAPLLWIAADIIAAVRYEGYSYTAQAVSELSAIGAPTRAFLIRTGLVYIALQIAFAVGVWRSAGLKRALRMTGGTLFVLGVVSVIAAFFPMSLREAEKTFADTMHIILSGAMTVLLILLAIGFGATAFGVRWRIYSYATILILLAFGAWAALDAPRVGANLPTPWMGLRERINAYGYMLWMLSLSITLLRTPTTTAQDNFGGGSHSGMKRITPHWSA